MIGDLRKNLGFITAALVVLYLVHIFTKNTKLPTLG